MPKGIKYGGRVKGTPNKITTTVREAVLATFYNLGGAQGMTDWGKKNQTEFYRIASRLIPTEIVGAGADGEITHRVIHETRAK